MKRRDRLAGFERLGFIANAAAVQLATLDLVGLPLDLARRVQDLAAAARAVTELAEQEILTLESARDWAEDA